MVSFLTTRPSFVRVNSAQVLQVLNIASQFEEIFKNLFYHISMLIQTKRVSVLAFQSLLIVRCNYVQIVLENKAS